MHSDLRFPPPPSSLDTPVWDGLAFQVGDSRRRILSYDAGLALTGWSDASNSIYDTAVEHHYIDIASRRNVITSLGRWLTGAKPAIIDIGCASGLTLKLIRQSFPFAEVIGADFFEATLVRLSTALPNVPLLQFDLARCPLPDQFVDAAVALNVLEHIEDDEAAIHHLFRILRPGGVACIEVPVGPDLYDMYDMDLGHHRRYKTAELIARLKAAGFEILHSSHLGFLVFPAFWAMKKRNRRHSQLEPAKRKELIRRNITTSRDVPLMHAVMTLEEWLRKRVYLPFGIRSIVTCRRP
jgi:SAM-dependent methyltransferase